ncbi:hypothetical protein G9A89_003829 [Geosiphon pyriformis]|nr:hypothetical protein G9A89_003829 [Geosiphon pyriformis]
MRVLKASHAAEEGFRNIQFDNLEDTNLDRLLRYFLRGAATIVVTISSLLLTAFILSKSNSDTSRIYTYNGTQLKSMIEKIPLKIGISEKLFHKTTNVNNKLSNLECDGANILNSSRISSFFQQKFSNYKKLVRRNEISNPSNIEEQSNSIKEESPTLISSRKDPNYKWDTYPIKRRISHKESLKLMKRMTIAANFGYCSKENTIGEILFNSDIIADAYLDKVEHDLVVFFKGPTLNLDEWKQRKISLSQFSNKGPLPIFGNVDTVWNRQVKIMMPGLIKKVKSLLEHLSNFKNGQNLDQFSPKIILTGHGIGGAFAVIAGLYLNQEVKGFGHRWSLPIHESQIKVVTFGQPRIGDSTFASLVEKEIFVYRVTFRYDPIPRLFLPRSTFIHHYNEFWIAEPDCNCRSTPEGVRTIDGKHVVYDCKGSKKRHLKIGENLHCNADPEIEVTNDMKIHWGPYFKQYFGDCLAMKRNKAIIWGPPLNTPIEN